MKYYIFQKFAEENDALKRKNSYLELAGSVLTRALSDSVGLLLSAVVKYTVEEGTKAVLEEATAAVIKPTVKEGTAAVVKHTV